MSSIDPSRELIPWTPPDKMDLVTYMVTASYYGAFYNPLPPYTPYTLDYPHTFGISTSDDELKMKLLKLGWKKIN